MNRGTGRRGKSKTKRCCEASFPTAFCVFALEILIIVVIIIIIIIKQT